jgi:hypothetical protein
VGPTTARIAKVVGPLIIEPGAGNVCSQQPRRFPRSLFRSSPKTPIANGPHPSAETGQPERGRPGFARDPGADSPGYGNLARYAGSPDSLELRDGVRSRKAESAPHPFVLSPSSFHILSGQRRVSSRDSPVSRRLLRLARIAGHPVDVDSISFESALSISWIRVSLTASPFCSSS